MNCECWFNHNNHSQYNCANKAVYKLEITRDGPVDQRFVNSNSCEECRDFISKNTPSRGIKASNL